jgi:hypothetical protein
MGQRWENTVSLNYPKSHLNWRLSYRRFSCCYEYHGVLCAYYGGREESHGLSGHIDSGLNGAGHKVPLLCQSSRYFCRLGAASDEPISITRPGDMSGKRQSRRRGYLFHLTLQEDPRNVPHKCHSPPKPNRNRQRQKFTAPPSQPQTQTPASAWHAAACGRSSETRSCPRSCGCGDRCRRSRTR